MVISELPPSPYIYSNLSPTQHTSIPVLSGSINGITHLLKPGPINQPCFFPLLHLLHQSLRNYSHFNFQNISGLCPPLSISTVWFKRQPSHWTLQQPLSGLSLSLVLLRFNQSSSQRPSENANQILRCFLFIIFYNSHNSIKHLVFGQYLFLALPSSNPISDEASMFCMFRSWSHMSFSDSSHCSRILSACVCWVNGVMLGVRLAKVSLLEKVFYILNNYLTDLRELAAGDKGSLAAFPSVNNPKLELLAGCLAMQFLNKHEMDSCMN